jgi:CRISPR-associated endonuclease/helicase Cas3
MIWAHKMKTRSLFKMNSNQLLAHPGQPLADHLSGVARLAEEFASYFSAGHHGRLAGLLHDLGKAEKEFQMRISSDDKLGEKQPHAHHGAALALAQDHWPVAFVVNGHHAGLHNRGDLAKRSDYFERATACLEKIQCEGFNSIPKQFASIVPKWLEALGKIPQKQMFAVEFFTRFLFSALVDADRLDTEESNTESTTGIQMRKQWQPFDATTFLKLTDNYISGKQRNLATLAERERNVQRVRDEVANHCRTAASQARGLFSLTVPTGGGKTLASLLFALSHAKAHAHDESRPNEIVWKPIRRVIVVIPYLSIIQQTALELKKVFGDVRCDEATKNWIPSGNPSVVLEHHSQAADPEMPAKRKKGDTDDDNYSHTRTLRQLAAENWDAPIIVTTSVQFFDSLFSRRPADARKLHNIAQSVIIFDEVQTFPPHLLQPILNVLGELTNPDQPYGCSAVFCTATQPALGHDEAEFPVGLKNVRAIVPTEIARKHFNDLQRVTYAGLQKETEPEIFTAEEVAKQAMANERKQCLVVVNTRNSAQQIFAAMQAKAAESPDAVFHLSTWMIPAHRLQVLDEVRRRLIGGHPCFLVSTQCIEAGVDVDFPEVWRAYGPYDSIVQAAGRCNREGKLKNASGQSVPGTVRVFRLEGDDPENRSGIYGVATAQTTLLRKMGRALPEDPESFYDYFRLLYQISVPDECLIQQNRAELRFEEVSKLFQFIEDQTFPVLVRELLENGAHRQTESFEIYGKARARDFFTREDWRVLQRDIVTLPLYKQAELLGEKLIEDCFDGERHLFLLVGEPSGRIRRIRP